MFKSKDIYQIQSRFKNIVSPFQTAEKDYNSSYIKKHTALPYNSRTFIGKPRKDLVLHFGYSYNEPIMFLYDISTNCFRNYIDLDTAKYILDDEIYLDIKTDLSYPRNLDYRYKGVQNVNNFVEQYQSIINDYRKKNDLSEYNCIDIEMEL